MFVLHAVSLRTRGTGVLPSKRSSKTSSGDLSPPNLYPRLRCILSANTQAVSVYMLRGYHRTATHHQRARFSIRCICPTPSVHFKAHLQLLTRMPNSLASYHRFLMFATQLLAYPALLCILACDKRCTCLNAGSVGTIVRQECVADRARHHKNSSRHRSYGSVFAAQLRVRVKENLFTGVRAQSQHTAKSKHNTREHIRLDRSLSPSYYNLAARGV